MEPEQFECGFCEREDAFLLSEKDFGTPNVVVPGWISWKPIIVKCPHCGEHSKFNCDWDKYLQIGEDTDWLPHLREKKFANTCVNFFSLQISKMRYFFELKYLPA